MMERALHFCTLIDIMLKNTRRIISGFGMPNSKFTLIN